MQLDGTPIHCLVEITPGDPELYELITNTRDESAELIRLIRLGLQLEKSMPPEIDIPTGPGELSWDDITTIDGNSDEWTLVIDVGDAYLEWYRSVSDSCA